MTSVAAIAGDIPKIVYVQGNFDVNVDDANQPLDCAVYADSLVLLKNDPALLPVDPATAGKVVVVGNLASMVTLGGYSGAPTVKVSAVRGITNALPGATVVADACGTSTSATAAATCKAQTMTDLAAADLVVVFVGTDSSVSGEGNDRETLALPGNYQSLIDQVTREADQSRPRAGSCVVIRPAAVHGSRRRA